MRVDAMSPGITSMIRLDHSHVMAVFHRFKPDTAARRKQALVANACLALEVHAQLEEEIFYPALRQAVGPDEVLDKSVPEHDEMRRLIGRLRAMEPGTPGYDDTFRELMRAVTHHVADEEATLLPRAETALHDQLGRLGMEMTRRRMQLLKPHAGELAATTAMSFPAVPLLLAAGALLLGVLLFGRRAGTSRRVGRPRGRRPGVETVQSIDVEVPVSVAYNQWTQFEEFPRFMEGVKEITQLDDQRLRWRAVIGGKEEEWEARITEQIPDERIAWTSTSGARNAGVVTFHRLSDTRTRVTHQLYYEPRSAIEKIGSAAGVVERRIRGDLERFKEFIESRGRETGAWRGTISPPLQH